MENQFDYCRHQHNIKSYYFLIQCLSLLIPITHKQRSMFQSESIQGCKCHIVFEIQYERIFSVIMFVHFDQSHLKVRHSFAFKINYYIAT